MTDLITDAKDGYSAELRFWSHVGMSVGAGCWNWKGSLNRQRGRGDTGRYGQFWYQGKIAYAYRYSYELYKGPITEGLTVDHLCGNTKCVNPSHLELVSNRENILRGNGACAVNLIKTFCKNGHPFTKENTLRYSGRRECRICKGTRQKAYALRKEGKG